MLRRTACLAASVCLFLLVPGLEARAQTARGVTMTVSVTTGTGGPVEDAKVTLTGPVNREGETIPNGTIRFTGLKAGSYRVRVEHPRFVTLERAVTVRTGKLPPVEMTLSDAPEPPPEPPEPDQAPAAAPPGGPPGEPRAVVIADFVEKNFISGREPRREDELGCTASAKTRLVQLREATQEESSADADEVIYVVAGEGTLRLGNRDVSLDSSSLAVVPRGTVRALSPRGRNPLIVVSVLSGPSCTAAPAE